jgi:hypothetical protein
MSQIREPGQLQRWQAAVTDELRNASDAVFARQVSRVRAVRRHAVGMLAADADARLVDERRAEHMHVARSEAMHAYRLITLGEPAAVGVTLEWRRLDLVVVRETVSREDAVLLAEVVVDARVERVRVVGVRAIDHVVVIQPGLVRLGIQRQQPNGVGIEARRGNAVAGERFAYEAVRRRHSAGDRIDLPYAHFARGCGIEHRAARERAAERVGADRAALQRHKI